MAAADDIEALLCERYNIAAPDDGKVFAALADVQSDPSPEAIALLGKEIGARALYHWHAPIHEAFAVLQAEQAPKPRGATKAAKATAASPVEPTT